jgi:phosphoglycerate kinase
MRSIYLVLDMENDLVAEEGPNGKGPLGQQVRARGIIPRTAAALAHSGRLVAVAGGGDTVSALNQAKVADDFTFVSTAGGAFLEWMEGKALPGVEALKHPS